jgi:hypothetical protein
VSWRTVRTFAAGALATVAGAVLVWWCRGAAQADSAVTDWMLRWWAGSGVGPCVVVSNHRCAGATTPERTSGT